MSDDITNPTTAQLYRVKWRSRSRSGAMGQGSPRPRSLAEDAADIGNETYPELYHWIEPVTNG